MLANISRKLLAFLRVPIGAKWISIFVMVLLKQKTTTYANKYNIIMSLFAINYPAKKPIPSRKTVESVISEMEDFKSTAGLCTSIKKNALGLNFIIIFWMIKF